MRGAMAMVADPAFDLPPQFAILERRMAGQALDCWLAQGGGVLGGGLVPGFDANSLIIADPFGTAMIESVGAAVSATFGLAAGTTLASAGLAAELRAVCGLMALDLQPQSFEASLAIGGDGCILLRGIALPIGIGVPDFVQVVVNWREILNRSATTRLRRELGAALHTVRANPPGIDPFGPGFGSKSPR